MPYFVGRYFDVTLRCVSAVLAADYISFRRKIGTGFDARGKPLKWIFVYGSVLTAQIIAGRLEVYQGRVKSEYG